MAKEAEVGLETRGCPGHGQQRPKKTGVRPRKGTPNPHYSSLRSVIITKWAKRSGWSSVKESAGVVTGLLCRGG